MNQQDDRTDATAIRQVVVPNKVFERSGADSSDSGRGQRGPSEVSGSRSWPREMEAMSRFQQQEVVELPAPAQEMHGGGSGKGNR